TQGPTHAYFINIISLGVKHAAGRVPFHGANSIFIAEKAKNLLNAPAARVLVHELGHSLNLQHVLDKANLMHKGKSGEGTDMGRGIYSHKTSPNKSSQYCDARYYGLENKRFLQQKG
ncbi:MAG: hypothetical protein R3F37_11730, partial [Candidatus Competibacteraceae bacterium]